MNDLITRLRALADTPDPTPQIQRALREAADALEAKASPHWWNEFERAEKAEAKLAELEAQRGRDQYALMVNAHDIDEARAEAAALKAKLKAVAVSHQNIVGFANETVARAEKAEAEAKHLRTELAQTENNIGDIRESYEAGREVDRAEAAALRKVILNVVEIDRLIGGNVPEVQVREIRHFDSDSVIVTDFIDALSQPGPGAALLEDYKRTQRDYRELWDSRDDVIKERNELLDRVKGLEWVRQAATAYLNLGGDYRQKILNHALTSLEKKP